MDESKSPDSARNAGRALEDGEPERKEPFGRSKGSFLSETNFPVPNVQMNNPLHGVTLEQILNYLVENLGWIEMNRRVEINCFFSNPSVKSSLKFLRKNNWARIKVERLYLDIVAGSEAQNRDWHE